MGQFDLDKLLQDKKKNGMNASFEKAQREKELEKRMQELGLNADEYKIFIEQKDSYRPTLYDISLVLDDFIVGEYFNRLALFVCLALSKISVYMAGPAASGKTALMDAAIDCIIPKDVLLISNASDKAIYEQLREITEASYIIMPEINKINPMMFEILKDWSEGKSSFYNRAGGIASHLAKTELPSKPFCFSKADESCNIEVPEELVSRIVVITVDSSQEQTKKVLARKAQNIADPFNIKHVDVVKKALLRYHIHASPTYSLYINPMGPELIETIPTIFTSSRRDFDKYTKCIEGISRFYHKDRLKAVIDGHEVQFISPQDVAINQMIMGKILVKSSLHCSDLDKLILQVVKTGGSITKSQVQTNLRKCSVNTTGKNIDSRLKDLIDIGYIDEVKEGSNKFYSVSDFYKEFILKPDFRKIVDAAKYQMLSNEKFRPYAEEYINRYCTDDKLFIIDPFTGVNINILEYDFSASVDMGEDDTRIKILDAAQETVKKPVSLADFV